MTWTRKLRHLPMFLRDSGLMSGVERISACLFLCRSHRLLRCEVRCVMPQILPSTGPVAVVHGSDSLHVVVRANSASLVRSLNNPAHSSNGPTSEARYLEDCRMRRAALIKKFAMDNNLALTNMDAAEKAMMAEVEAKEAETMLKDIEIFGLDPRNPDVIHLVSIGRAERRRAQKLADLPPTTEERAHRQFLLHLQQGERTREKIRCR